MGSGASSLIQVERRLRHAGGDQGGQVERLVAAGLRVADPDLDRAERVMGPHAPPELRRLDDRVRVLQQLDEVRVGPPVAERLVDAAARECPGEDLRAHGVQAGVAMVEEGRVRREGEQRRQELPHPVGDRNGPVGPPDPDVDVEAPGVVPLRDPAQVSLQPAVVLGLDDVLVEVVGPGMGAHRRQRESHLVGDPEQPLSPGSLALAASAKVSPRPERISISVSISSPLTACASSGSRRQAWCISSKRCSRSRIAGSRIANSSSIPTVKSVDASKSLADRVEVQAVVLVAPDPWSPAGRL